MISLIWKVYFNEIVKLFPQLTGSGAGVIGEAGVGDAGGEDEDTLQPKPMVKKKKKAGRTNKVGCTATIIMKEVIYYPEFQVSVWLTRTLGGGEQFCQ